MALSRVLINDGQRVLDSVELLPAHPPAVIKACRLDHRLYNEATTPVVVTYDWREQVDSNGIVPLRTIVPLLLENKLPNWRSAEVAETWENQRTFLLGESCGRVSSLFVSRESGQGDLHPEKRSDQN